jgi:L-amino acid N-acyltransferase YncA
MERMPEGVTLRPATLGDLAAVSAIYNHYVQSSTRTYQTELESLADRRAWFDAHDTAHPVIVAEREGVVLGWASLSRYMYRNFKHPFSSTKSTAG